ncbi:hypothetical protein EAH89_10920 [Roseomonas nepalensis]|uniref:Uncharacterized protein n=1 Tax=Muricoccus nepalensis TaxID=1854500 RepID=A0A502G8T1_9PROT|nr:hypothetical protein [Roseomonas nepalensis]TPG57436.1 hypothetical protein EAH89_10920 [Roseomonas nepalensis]
MAGAEETQKAVRKAMVRYEAMVLNKRNFDPASQTYRYPNPISAAEILRMAGVRSRSTLAADYHGSLRRELEVLIEDLKRQTGKGKVAAKEATKTVLDRTDRVEQLAQTVAALQYKIIALEKELATLRQGQPTSSQVVNLERQERGLKRR